MEQYLSLRNAGSCSFRKAEPRFRILADSLLELLSLDAELDKLALSRACGDVTTQL